MLNKPPPTFFHPVLCSTMLFERLVFAFKNHSQLSGRPCSAQGHTRKATGNSPAHNSGSVGGFTKRTVVSLSIQVKPATRRSAASSSCTTTQSSEEAKERAQALVVSVGVETSSYVRCSDMFTCYIGIYWHIYTYIIIYILNILAISIYKPIQQLFDFGFRSKDLDMLPCATGPSAELTSQSFGVLSTVKNQCQSMP